MKSYRFGTALALALTLAGCRFDRSRSPVCGFELLAGPRLIQDRLNDARALLTDAPRGLPDVLPARVAGRADTAHAIRGTAQGQLALVYEGAYFPPGISDSTVYGLLVVDDSSERVIGLARGSVTAITGKEIRLRADTICLHGDTPGAAVIARRVRERLDASGTQVRPLGEFLRREA